uniref:RING-type domain-containing protein n=1 Tax=Steinernema glaseri TaxID=37863 RepID=A0A1I7Y982_9BILA
MYKFRLLRKTAAEKVVVMKLTELDVPAGIRQTVCFTILNGWLYYRISGEETLRKYNLSTGEEKEIHIEGFKRDRFFLSSVHGQIHVFYFNNSDSPGYAAKLEFETSKAEVAKVTREESFGCSSVLPLSQSVLLVGERIFCLENYQFYDDIVHLEDDGRKKTSKPLRLLNDADVRCALAFLCSDIVYYLSTKNVRLVKLNLEDCTMEDVTDNVEDITDVQRIYGAAEIGDAIYLMGEDICNKKTFWKLQINSTGDSESTNGICCGVYLSSFDVPKILPCGHSICESYERELSVENKKKEKKSIFCPFCRRTVVLETDETLPINYSLKSLLEKSTSQDSFVCFTCGEQQRKDNCFYCETCTHTDKKTVLVCGSCACKKHRNHEFEEAKFPSRAAKKKAIVAADTLKIETDEERISPEEIISKRTHEKFETLKTSVESMELKFKSVIEDPNITPIDLENAISELKELDTKARSELKSIEEWKETVLAAIRS